MSICCVEYETLSFNCFAPEWCSIERTSVVFEVVDAVETDSCYFSPTTDVLLK